MFVLRPLGGMLSGVQRAETGTLGRVRQPALAAKEVRSLIAGFNDMAGEATVVSWRASGIIGAGRTVDLREANARPAGTQRDKLGSNANPGAVWRSSSPTC